MWRCFHCDEVFHSRQSAAVHFGADEGKEPACKLKGHERHLVEYIRELESDLDTYRREDSHVMRSMYSLEADHRQALLRAEELGYARGVKDAQLLSAPVQTAPAGDLGSLATRETLWARSPGHLRREMGLPPLGKTPADIPSVVTSEPACVDFYYGKCHSLTHTCAACPDRKTPSATGGVS